MSTTSSISTNDATNKPETKDDSPKVTQMKEKIRKQLNFLQPIKEVTEDEDSHIPMAFSVRNSRIVNDGYGAMITNAIKKTVTIISYNKKGEIDANS